MDAAGQQKILGYFIEEAKEHLETIEQGILELSTVTKDPEKLNEMFRAAHSVKGGAAMLGYTSIQKTAHRLEDAFKLLKENEVAVDQNLESLFFRGYDVLQELIELLQGPFGLSDEEADKITNAAEPNFEQLQDYLNHLVGGGATAISKQREAEKLAAQAKEMLQAMLKLFQKDSTVATRKELQSLCFRLSKLAPKEKNWQNVAKAAHKAVGNPKHSFLTLAPVVIKELKHGSDLLCLEQGSEIFLSDSLKQLAIAKYPQVLLPVEPRAAAKILLRSFNKQQLSQIAKLIAAK